MPRSHSSPVYEAVFFMQDHGVSRQMRYSEFEAILDGVVALPDYADTEATLVYVELDQGLQIQALVFFLLYFDEDGRADPEWSLPLQQLAKKAGSGPTLGDRLVRLCCRSQCPINWHQKAMWDPGMKPGANDFQAIQRAVGENRLRFEKIDSESSETIQQPLVEAKSAEGAAPDGLSHEHRIKIARLIRAQRLHIKTLIGQHQDELAEATRLHRIEQQALKTELQDSRQHLEQLKVQNEQLKATLSQREQQLVQLEARLGEADASARDSAQRNQTRLEAELVILKEQLARRDSELQLRGEREDRLKSELESLKASLERAGQGDVISRLIDLDIIFVVYHPGAGHITIPPADLEAYMTNPIGYAAAQCHVSEGHYRRWLAHYDNPVCTHQSATGEPCGEPLLRVTEPAEFVPGQHDYCEQHAR